MASILRWSNSVHLPRSSSLLIKRLNHTFYISPETQARIDLRANNFKIRKLGGQYIRTIEMYIPPSEIISEGPALKEAVQNGELTPKQQRHWNIYQELMQLEIPKEFSTQEKENNFAEQMKRGMGVAKTLENRSISKLLPAWWEDICTRSGMGYELGSIPKEKRKRGFEDPVCGMLLCPAELNWDDVQVREQLRTGRARINGEPVDITDWPKFLHSFPINQDRPWLTLLRGPLLVRAYRHVFTIPEDDPLAPSTVIPSFHGQQYGMTSVTRASISYLATQLLFTLNPRRNFSTKISSLDPVRFYNSLIEYLYDPVFERQVKDLLEWWNEKIFSNPIPREPRKPKITAHQRMREALLASEADSEH